MVAIVGTCMYMYILPCRLLGNGSYSGHMHVHVYTALQVARQW